MTVACIFDKMNLDLLESKLFYTFVITKQKRLRLCVCLQVYRTETATKSVKYEHNLQSRPPMQGIIFIHQHLEWSELAFCAGHELFRHRHETKL